MHKADRLSDDDLLLLEAEIDDILTATPQGARDLLADIVRLRRTALIDQFYDVMMAYPGGDVFLGNELVSGRLHGAMEAWLMELFNAGIRSGGHIRKHQMDVGAVHARIKVPVSLVMRGFRELKRMIMRDLVNARSTPDTLAMAANLLTSLLDVALAIMTAAYVRHSERVTRSDEALRLYSVGQDLAAERERQRAAVLEWGQHVFFEAQLPERGQRIATLSQSEFGLWFSHRAEIIFGLSAEYDTIVDCIDRCDAAIGTINDGQTADRIPLIRSIKGEVDKISALMALLFDGAIGVNSARDPLTKLLSRQFLNSAVSREIGLTQEGKPPFCLVTFTLNKYDARRLNVDQHGWDEILRRSAQIVLGMSRSSDSAFRLNDDTFLVVRVESTVDAAQHFAQEVAHRITSAHFSANGQTYYDLTLLHSVTQFDGHPDPRHIIRLAEQNLAEMAPG